MVATGAYGHCEFSRQRVNLTAICCPLTGSGPSGARGPSSNGAWPRAIVTCWQSRSPPVADTLSGVCVCARASKVCARLEIGRLLPYARDIQVSDDPNEFSFYFPIGYAAPGDWYEDYKDEQEAAVLQTTL